MPTRDLSNGRVALYAGTANSVANLQQPTAVEIAAMLPIHDVVRWSGFTLGAKASTAVNDRSLSDNGGAVTRGFNQFSGGLPLYYPKVTEVVGPLRSAFNLFKIPRTSIIIVERIGFKDASQPIVAGDNVNVYRLMTDGFNPDTTGDGGYAYVLDLLPQGDVYPWTIVPAASPAAVTIIGTATATLSLAGVNRALRGASYQGKTITPRAVWSSSAPAVASVDNRGLITGLSAGTANVTATFPGGTASSAVAVTVAA